MIKISHLTKIFKSKHKEKCVALNDVSVDLEEQGFVFIVGKSGSGKTTLLNMIAALDGYNSGEIIVNGLSLNKLKHNQYDYYRNKNIGFIFQDYQLLDELTVFDNVKVALDFINDKDTSKVYNALESVGLKGFENRYPSQLSGGEKQRVAIARAMVKDPAIILADEPTGNLDSATSKEILNILKEISKTKLVLIVSHNIFDAYEFASFILELSYGKLIGTYKRNDTYTSSIEIKDKILRLPLHKDLIESEKQHVINDINNDIIDVIQDDQDFVACDLINNDTQEVKKITKKHISFKNAFKLGIAFLKKSMLTISVYSLIIGAIFGVIYSSEVIIKTDKLESLAQHKLDYDKDLITLTDKQNSESLYNKKNIYVNFVDDKDIADIKKKGYNDAIYPTYMLFSASLYDSITPFQPRGIKLVDDEYFTFFTGQLELCYQSDEYQKVGTYITDYIIDIYNLYQPYNFVEYDDYEKIENMFHLIHLNGVINTHHKEKYPDVYEATKKYLKNNKSIKVFDEVNDKRMSDFIYDNNFYCYFYSLESNYLDLILDYDKSSFYGYDMYKLNYQDKSYSPLYSKLFFGNFNKNALGVYAYQNLTGKQIDFNKSKIVKLEEPITVKIDLFESENDSNKIKSKTMTFDYVFADDYYGLSSIILDKSDKELCKDFMITRDVTFKNNKDLQNIFKRGLFKNLTINDYSIVTLQVHERLTSIFNKIFKLVIILLLLSSFVSLIFYSAYLVKKNVRNIGVLKSLGGRSKDILIALSLNIVITSVLAALLSIGCSYLFLFIIEKILLVSFKSASMDFCNTYGLSYLLNNGVIIGLNVAFIIVLLMLSSVLIFARLNKYKPTELIKGAK